MTTTAASFIGSQPFKEAIGKFALEIAESAILGLAGTEAKIELLRERAGTRAQGHLARPRHQARALPQPGEPQRLSRGLWRIYRRQGRGASPHRLWLPPRFHHEGRKPPSRGRRRRFVRLPDAMAHAMWDYYGQHEDNELLIFHSPW